VISPVSSRWFPPSLLGGFPRVFSVVSPVSSRWFPPCLLGGFPRVFSVVPPVSSRWFPPCLLGGFPRVFSVVCPVSSRWFPRGFSIVKWLFSVVSSELLSLVYKVFLGGVPRLALLYHWVYFVVFSVVFSVIFWFSSVFFWFSSVVFWFSGFLRSVFPWWFSAGSSPDYLGFPGSLPGFKIHFSNNNLFHYIFRSV
jgi:hypothetical protein